MLNGREKMGNLGIDWKEYALGANHFKRRTVGFGKYDKKEREWEKEIFLREMSIIEGGIGCSTWDAAIIFSRWVYRNQDAFTDKTVLELGSGTGLPGILSAFYSKHVTLSDYLNPLVENLKYNIELNAKQQDGFDSDDEEANKAEKSLDLENIRNKTKVINLNWDEIDTNTDDSKYDIIFGSELTYSMLSVDNLIKVIQKFLKEDGIFYEILSDDRDGVSYFIDEMSKRGFENHIVPVDQQFLGNYGTKQRPETYKFYSFRYSKNVESNKHKLMQ
ncbi:hypothetical protein ACTA71_003663 [Dictyostelium dimigraforme]